MKKILAATTAICAAKWFFSWLAIRILLCFMREKGYTPPTKEELRTCSRKTVEEIFKGSWKNKSRLQRR